MPAFAKEINYRPMFLALLQMGEVQISQFAASGSAAKQHGEDRSVPLSFQRVQGGLRELLATSEGSGRTPARYSRR